MISDYAGLRQWDISDTEAIFVQGVFAQTSMLGLEETTAQREQDAQKRSRESGHRHFVSPSGKRSQTNCKINYCWL
jgi:hypothetical protein